MAKKSARCFFSSSTGLPQQRQESFLIRQKGARSGFAGILSCSLLFLFGGSVQAQELHKIEFAAEKIEGGYFAYRMRQHLVSDLSGGNAVDVTSRYPDGPTIPGPTIVIKEGDEVDLTLYHQFDPASPAHEHVSVHVHGVHYDIESDGTLEYINHFKDESAIPVMSYKYRWIAAPGTAGTWPYHDHNMLTHNGAEDRGLYGAVIVNPASNTTVMSSGDSRQTVSLDTVTKDYVLYLFDDAFAGTEIDRATGRQSYGGANPALTAQKDTNVRFHLIALGTNFHRFELPGYNWPEPGTDQLVSAKTLGPIEKYVFTVNATQSSSYQDTALNNLLLGMRGAFLVSE